MRIPKALKLCALAVPLVLTCAAARAESTQIVNGVTDRMPVADLSDFEGEYTLSNGSLLDVIERGHHLYARIDNTAAKKIIATGPHDFVSADGSLRIVFDRHENGVVPGLTMTMQVRR